MTDHKLEIQESIPTNSEEIHVEHHKPTKLAITDEVKKSWYEKEITSVDAFIKELDLYDHDYDSICRALGAIAYQSAKLANRTMEGGGITGFQAGAVMWEFIQNWMHFDGPMKLVDFNEMLYPQYNNKFQKTISAETWKHVQQKAFENLQKYNLNDIAPEVAGHWMSITMGTVPFGYTVRDEE